jgi:hypothetical protein
MSTSKRRRGGAFSAPLKTEVIAPRGTLHLSFTRRRSAGRKLYAFLNLNPNPLPRGERELFLLPLREKVAKTRSDLSRMRGKGGSA